MQLEEISIDVVGSFSGGIMPRDASRICVLRKVCFFKDKLSLIVASRSKCMRSNQNQNSFTLF